MPTSYNGWPASKVPASLGCVTYEVPTVTDRSFTTVLVARPLFRYVIRRFHAEVEPVHKGKLDDWSYNYREIRGGGALSCHASGTAIDLNATHFPMGATNMTKEQRARTREIVAACRKQIRWGGEFGGERVDEMHFELSPGTTVASVAAAVAAMCLYPDGRQIHPRDLAEGADPVRVKLLKKSLAAVHLYPNRRFYTGKWNTQLGQSWMAWRIKKPRQSPTERIDALGIQAGLF